MQTHKLFPVVFAAGVALLMATTVGILIDRGGDRLGAPILLATVFLLMISLIAGQRRILRVLPHETGEVISFQLYTVVLFGLLGMGIAFFAGFVARGGVHH